MKAVDVPDSRKIFLTLLSLEKTRKDVLYKACQGPNKNPTLASTSNKKIANQTFQNAPTEITLNTPPQTKVANLEQQILEIKKTG